MSRRSSQSTDTRLRVILVALQAFREKGLKEVRMDDIAHALKISKRTLYQIFKDKEELIIATIDHEYEEIERLVEEKSQEVRNVLELILCIIEYRMKRIKECTPCFFTDLKRYPRLLEHLDSKQGMAAEAHLLLFQRGVEEGWFLPNFDYHFILRAMLAQFRDVLNDERFADESLEHCFLCLVLVTLRGCATLQGIELIDRFMQEHELC